MKKEPRCFGSQMSFDDIHAFDEVENINPRSAGSQENRWQPADPDGCLTVEVRFNLGKMSWSKFSGLKFCFFFAKLT